MKVEKYSRKLQFPVCRLDNIILLLRKVTCNTFSLIALFLNLSLFHYPLIVFIYFQECLVINSKTIHHSIQSLKHFPLTTTRSQGVYSNETIKEGISRATTKPRLSFANVYGRIKISFNWIAWWRVSLAITLRGLGPCYVLGRCWSWRWWWWRWWFCWLHTQPTIYCQSYLLVVCRPDYFHPTTPGTWFACLLVLIYCGNTAWIIGI